ncbi:hypothetical protein HK405_002614 [Cladochytrium tenue]|nr:hypothetical protein HK405_002614 [Cladochytrium tenue]
MNLVLAFTIATKNYLREEDELSDDVAALVAHIPEYAARIAAQNAAADADASADSKGLSGRGLPPAAASLDAAAMAEDKPLSLPMELTLHLQAFTNYCRRNELVDIPVQNQLTAAVSALVDSVTSFERIRSSPIPFAYNIHLKQTLLVYLLSLPFQLLPGIFWATVPAVFLASFVFLGIEAIGGQIENPFGYDPNDLPQDEYIDEIREEIQHMVVKHSNFDTAGWVEPYPSLAKAVTPEVAAATAAAAAAAKQEKKGLFGRRSGTGSSVPV